MKQRLTLLIILITYLYCFFLVSCNRKKLSLQVIYTTEGCFGSQESKLTVFDMMDSTVAILETKGQKTKQVTLGEEQHPAMAAFLSEFKLIPDKNCYNTTEENYVVTYVIGSEETTSTKRYNCREWNGFERLKNVLFNYKRQTLE